MEEKKYTELIKKIEEFLEVLEMSGKIQQSKAIEIEETLKKANLFNYGILWEKFKNEASIWERILQRMDIPREERIHGVFGAIVVIAYEKSRKKQK